jgi:predicted dehydrogenase
MKLKFGMVGGGGGGIGPMHIRGALMDHLCELKAGCFSRSADKNATWADIWGVKEPDRIYPDYESMALAEGAKTGDDRLDFVVIVTPNDSHYGIAKRFLEQGFNIVSDKPLALNSTQGEELVQLSRAKNLLFGVTYTYAGYALIRQMREMVESGELGDLIYINVEYPQEWFALGLTRPTSSNAMWRQDPAKVGPSQATADIGSHCEFLIKAATGLTPKRVLAKFDHIPRDLPLESNTTVMLDYGNQISGLIWASQVALGHECDIRVRIFGTKGSVDWSHLQAGYLKVARIGEPVQIYSAASPYNHPDSNRLTRTNPGHPEGLFEAFGNIYRSFAECLLARKEGRPDEGFTYPTVEDGLNGVKFIEACVASNAAGNVWTEL